MRISRTQAIGATVGLVALSAFAPMAHASPPTGLTGPPLATASFDRRVDVHHNGVRLRTGEATDVRVQQFDFAPGSTSGWHHHPGLVVVVVASGSVTLWDVHCKTKVYGPGLPNGAAFIENGNQPGQATSAMGARTYATYIVPKADPSVFRVEDDAPACATT
jgi:hypothetical protein